MTLRFSCTSLVSLSLPTKGSSEGVSNCEPPVGLPSPPPSPSSETSVISTGTAFCGMNIRLLSQTINSRDTTVPTVTSSASNMLETRS